MTGFAAADRRHGSQPAPCAGAALTAPDLDAGRAGSDGPGPTGPLHGDGRPGPSPVYVGRCTPPLRHQTGLGVDGAGPDRAMTRQDRIRVAGRPAQPQAGSHCRSATRWWRYVA